MIAVNIKSWLNITILFLILLDNKAENCGCSQDIFKQLGGIGTGGGLRIALDFEKV